MSTSALAVLVPGLAFLLAGAYGAVSHRTGFCTMGAIADVVTFGDRQRLRAYVLAIVTAIAGAQALQAADLVDLSRSIYAAPRLAWIAHVTGGFAFGAGMTLASGCGSRNLVRLGGGNLKSLFVLLVLGISAYATLRGVLAPLRVHVLEAPRIAFDGPATLPALAGVAGPWLAGVLVVLGAAWCLRDAGFRAARAEWSGAVAIGLLIVGGWFVTGHVGFVPEDPDTLEAVYAGSTTGRPESFTFVGPVAFALELLMWWTDASRHVTFGIAAVGGTLAGAAIHALATRRFRWELFASPADLGRHALGAALMGFGGVTALGCSIGQGITGLSTLAFGSMLTLIAIVAGCVLTLQILQRTSG